MNRLNLFLIISNVGMCIGGLLFRATLYWKIPVTKNQPYGLGDILDGGFGVGVVLTSLLSFLYGLVLIFFPRLRNFNSALWLIGSALLSVLIYFLLHSRVPRLQ